MMRRFRREIIIVDVGGATKMYDCPGLDSSVPLTGGALLQCINNIRHHQDPPGRFPERQAPPAAGAPANNNIQHARY
jgi:hypothetical protein